MSVLQQIKETIGVGVEEQNRYRCGSCGTEFESHLDPDDTWLTCPDCDSRDIERRPD